MQEKKLIYGLKSISYILNNMSEHGIMTLVRDYDSFPVRKIGGRWASEENELVNWWINYINHTLNNIDINARIAEIEKALFEMSKKLDSLSLKGKKKK